MSIAHTHNENLLNWCIELWLGGMLYAGSMMMQVSVLVTSIIISAICC